MKTRLSADEELRLVALARTGDRDAESRLVVEHLRPAYSIVNRYVRRGAIPKEDLEQEAALALVTAVRRFDATRGVRFVTYAMWWVRVRVQRACRRWYHLSQEPPADGTRWIESMPENLNAPSEGVDLRLLRHLSPRRRAAVELVLGLNGHKPHSRVQLAAALGVRLGAANKLYLRALAQLRQVLRRRAAAAARRRAA
jgi:RNA polymerase sigma factor (sigma-70 family)